MSLRGVGKRLGSLGFSAFFLLAVPAWSWAQQSGQACGSGACGSGACFGAPSCGTATCGGDCCHMFHCPPAFPHCVEGPPCIHWKCGCPRPVCNPCDLPHWGYFDKCWTPWPFPPNWTHCPTPPPAAFVTLNPGVGTHTPAMPPRLPAQGGAYGPNPAPSYPGANPMPVGGQETLPQPQRYEAPGGRIPY